MQTTTITSTETTIHLRLQTAVRLTIEERIDKLVAEMGLYPHISEHLQGKIRRWKDQYKMVCDSKEALSIALSKLVITVIRKSIADNKEDFEIQDRLLTFEDLVIEILSQTLQPNEIPEDFIKMYKVLHAKEEEYINGVESLKQCSAVIQHQVSNEGMRTQSVLRENFVQVQAGISSLKDSKQQDSEDVISALNSLKIRADRIVAQSLRNGTEAVSLGNKLMSVQKDQDKLVQNATQVLGGNE